MVFNYSEESYQMAVNIVYNLYLRRYLTKEQVRCPAKGFTIKDMLRYMLVQEITHIIFTAKAMDWGA